LLGWFITLQSVDIFEADLNMSILEDGLYSKHKRSNRCVAIGF